MITLDKMGYKNKNPHDAATAVDILNEINDTRSDKGIYLFGPPGCGKTYFATLVLKTLFDIRYIKPFDLCDGTHCEWLGEGQYFEIFMKNYSALLIDDIGVEKDVNEFGIKSNPFADFINRFYVWKSNGNNYPLIFVTSNLTPDELVEKYGPRVFSRLKQLFTFAQFTGEDKRKLKIIGG